MSKLLVVDIGNTTTKVGTWNGATIEDVSVSPTDDHPRWDSAAGPLLGRVARAPAAPVAICSVVPAAEAALVRWDELQGKTPFLLRGDTPAPLVNLYRTPDRLGPDRLAAAVAAAHRFGAPVIIASLGTAVVVDAVSPAKEYLGGAIWVGMETGLAALVERTAGLPRVVPEQASRPIGRDTEECLLAGAFHGAAALVEGLAARMRDSIGNAPLVLTGGDADLISPLLRARHDVVPHLTLEGTALIWEHNRGG
ncbi:MAG: type III pantothenate kinase [Armatimonadota bacterium]